MNFLKKKKVEEVPITQPLGEKSRVKLNSQTLGRINAMKQKTAKFQNLGTDMMKKLSRCKEVENTNKDDFTKEMLVKYLREQAQLSLKTL